MCTERSDFEQSVLSDDWVSIPIGSEEAYSFKHMRKNQFEEALFRCEDERFEIDTCIDSNMCTLTILEPLAEEIQALRTLEESESRIPKFTFQLEKRNLGTIHLNAISRIYGEHGGEILELLRKNPVGTIPVLVKRLKQKDLEWRKARQVRCIIEADCTR
jgi:paired amphipathic helix protein Sin3a